MKITLFVSISLLFLINFRAGVYCQEKQGEAIFEQPLLITSVGQSAEVQLAAVLAKKAGLAYNMLQAATHNDLQNVKTLVLVLGASLKGMGAAGLDMDKEKQRINLLVKEASKRNIPILSMHLGGESRRGTLSDELTKEYLPFSKMVVVVKSGNHDGLFTKICKEHDIPLIEVEKTAMAKDPFQKAFK